jgi:hypothetical protein
MKIEIFTIEDQHECETCGSSWADGGLIKIDGREVFRFEPVANCFDGHSLSPDDLLAIALHKAGIEVYIEDVHNLEWKGLSFISEQVSGE